MNHIEAANLAKEILEKETPYFKDKLAISSFFNFNSDEYTKEIIEHQLTIIDSYYSTNMSKRYYGIEEIAESILKISSSKNELSKIFQEFVRNPTLNNEIIELFKSEYGYNKLGEKYGQANSLISKYAYFVTNYNFPIYDSIVRKVYPLIMKTNIKDDNIVNFIIQMKELLQSSNIENFDKLDNFLWLIGKIKRGNYSLILKKDNYLSLIKKFKYQLEEIEGKNFSEKLFYYIETNIDNLSNEFSKKQIEMIKYSINLKK